MIRKEPPLDVVSIENRPGNRAMSPAFIARVDCPRSKFGAILFPQA